MTKGTDLYLLDSRLELFYYGPLSLLLQHVDSGREENVREAISQEIGEVTFMVLHPVLSHLQKQIGH